VNDVGCKPGGKSICGFLSILGSFWIKKSTKSTKANLAPIFMRRCFYEPSEHLSHQHDQELLKNTIFVTHFQSLRMLWPDYPGVDPDVDFVLGEEDSWKWHYDSFESGTT
jgi:hypothetical protein